MAPCIKPPRLGTKDDTRILESDQANAAYDRAPYWFRKAAKCDRRQGCVLAALGLVPASWAAERTFLHPDPQFPVAWPQTWWGRK